MASVDQIFNLEAAEGDTFAGLTNVGDGFFDRLAVLGWLGPGWSKNSQRAGNDDLFRVSDSVLSGGAEPQVVHRGGRG